MRGNRDWMEQNKAIIKRARLAQEAINALGAGKPK